MSDTKRQSIVLWAYRAPWVCAPVGARRAWLSIALLLIWWLVVDLAAQIVETFAGWTLTHHQPRLYPTPTWLSALQTAGQIVCVSRVKMSCPTDHLKVYKIQYWQKLQWVLCQLKRCSSHLSPAAVGPLRTWTRLTRPLLVGSAAVLTAVGGVTVLVLANHHSPLEAACTRAGALLYQKCMADSLAISLCLQGWLY